VSVAYSHRPISTSVDSGVEGGWGCPGVGWAAGLASGQRNSLPRTCWVVVLLGSLVSSTSSSSEPEAMLNSLRVALELTPMASGVRGATVRVLKWIACFREAQ